MSRQDSRCLDRLRRAMMPVPIIDEPDRSWPRPQAIQANRLTQGDILALPGVSALTTRPRRARYNKAPSMYEMEGALSGLSRIRPSSCLADPVPPAGHQGRASARVPGFPALPASPK